MPRKHARHFLGWAVVDGDFSIVELGLSGLQRGVALAHEIGHVLGKSGHPAGNLRYRVMRDRLRGDLKGDHTDSRRFDESEEESFSGSKFFK